MTPNRHSLTTLEVSRLIGVCAAVIALLTFVTALIHQDPQDRWGIVVAASVANLLFGVVVFLRHGGVRITVLGLFNVAMSMFVGFAGAYAALEKDNRIDPMNLGFAILAASALQVLVVLFSRQPEHAAVPVPVQRQDANWAIRWGIIVLGVLTYLEVVAPFGDLGGWLEGAAVSATIVLAIGIYWRPQARLISFGTLIVGVAFILYAGVFHSGGGRLRIIALACGLLLLISLRFRKGALKWLAVAGAPVALFLLAQQRLTLQESLSVGASIGRNGLESMLVPIVILGQLIRAQAEGLALQWGSSLLSFPAALIPESWFPNAPKALGYELVKITSPGRYNTEFSTAGTVASEAIWNWSFVGIIIAAPLLAWLFAVIDRRIVRASTRAQNSRAAIVSLAFWVVIGGAIADLAWNGQHVFLIRTVTRLPILIGLWVVAQADDWLREARSTPRATTAVPARRAVRW